VLKYNCFMSIHSAVSTSSLPGFKDTFFLQFTDPIEQKKYEKYCQANMSYFSMFLVFSVLSIMGENMVFTSLILGPLTPQMIIIVCIGIIWALLFAILYVVTRKTAQTYFQLSIETVYKYSSILQNLLMVTASVGQALAINYRAVNGKCKNHQFVNLWNCNPEVAAHALPQDFNLMAMLFAITFPIIFKSIKFSVMCLCWLIVVAFITLSIIQTDAHNSISMLVFYVAMSVILMYDMQRQNLNAYFEHCKQVWLLSENERLADENHTTEMRHMIANVAHDLKTVRFFSFYRTFL
jgi:hypothetical protein